MEASLDEKALNSSPEYAAFLWREVTKERPDLKRKGLCINSKLSPVFGLGSSSALSLLFAAWSSKTRELETIVVKAFDLHNKWQKQSSGYDILSQAQGGLIEGQGIYQEEKFYPRKFQKFESKYLKNIADFFLFAGTGRGSDTKKALKQNTLLFKNKSTKDELRKACSENVTSYKNLILDPGSNSYESACYITKEKRQFLGQLNNSPRELITSIARLRGRDKSWSFKGTGAGGEDLFLFVCEVDFKEKLSRDLENIGLKIFSYQCSELGLEPEYFDHE